MWLAERLLHFTGFLDRNEVSQFYQLSDVYVMPSTSEPFGIVCLEAIAHDVPVVICNFTATLRKSSFL